MKCFLLFYLLFAAFFCGVCLADDNFTINIVAYGTSNSGTVAVDMNNSPVVVTSNLYDYSGLSIIKLKSNGYDVNQISHTERGTWPKLKITSNNELSLAYRKSMSDAYVAYELWYGSEGSWFDWIFSMINSQYDTISRPDIDLTDNDIPHIVYSRSGGPPSTGVIHSFFDVHSQQWIKEQLGGFGTGGISDLNIDIAPDGKMMVSCTTPQGVKVAVNSDGYWNYLPLLQSGEISSGSFAGDSLPAVAFTRDGQLIYAVYINDIIGWAETIVDPAVTSSSHYSVALTHSSTGIPGIAYSDNGTLMYASNVAGGWTTTMIDNQAYLDDKPSLIYDHNDKPLIVYNSFDDCIGMPVLKLAGIGLEPYNIADLNNDKKVNFVDFAKFAEYWLRQLPAPDKSVGDFTMDASVDVQDLRWMVCNWLWQGGN